MAAKVKVYIDFETFSNADIKKTGACKYAEDPSTKILCMGWAYEKGEPQIWTPWHPGLPRFLTKYRLEDIELAITRLGGGK